MALFTPLSAGASGRAPLRIIVAGGGTGGHLFPGLALIQELRRRHPETAVLFVGTDRGIEARILPARGESLATLDIIGVQEQRARAWMKALSRLPQAGVQALRILGAFRPDVVVGVGGYASGPMVAAARSLGIPTALMEQNAHVGKTNRWLAPWVGRAYVTFAETQQVFPRGVARVLGNPVRDELAQLGREIRCDPEGAAARGHSILILGGSRGAHALNQHLPPILAQALAGVSCKPSIVHQTGASDEASVRSHYQSLGLGDRVQVRPFIDDMAQAYPQARLVIARAGATTVAELAALGKPSILIPYPHATDGHQDANAQQLAQQGAAICVSQLDMPSQLGEHLGRFVRAPQSLMHMSKKALALGQPEAAANIVDDLLQWLDVPQLGCTELGRSQERARS